MAMTTTQTVSILFGAYGLNKDVDRQLIYNQVLKDVPPALLEKAVYKVLGEWENTFLPPPAVVIAAARSLAEAKEPEKKMLSWVDALAEIEKKMLSTQSYKKPVWSTVELDRAVNAFGWDNLIRTLEEDMPTVRAQLRRLYEDACSRTTDEARNAYLMGKNPMGVIGMSDRKPKGLQSVSDIVPELGMRAGI